MPDASDIVVALPIMEMMPLDMPFPVPMTSAASMSATPPDELLSLPSSRNPTDSIASAQPLLQAPKEDAMRAAALDLQAGTPVNLRPCRSDSTCSQRYCWHS